MTRWLLWATALLVPLQAVADEPVAYRICVSNERSGDVTVIDGASGTVAATVRAGKRPRGIHASPDGRTLYVALSGSPISGPPQLDAAGNPIRKDEDDEEADHAADGIGVIDLTRMAFVKKLPAGSDPEEFAVSRDGSRLYVSNEDVATLSVVSVADGQVQSIVRVKKEPEGVALSPDGSRVFVTCETGGEVVVIDSDRKKMIAEFHVGGRPRTVAFLPDGSRLFVPSETAGTLTVIDGLNYGRLGVIALPAGSRPMGTVMDAARSRLYVSTGRAGTVCVVDPPPSPPSKRSASDRGPGGSACPPTASGSTRRMAPPTTSRSSTSIRGRRSGGSRWAGVRGASPCSRRPGEARLEGARQEA